MTMALAGALLAYPVAGVLAQAPQGQETQSQQAPWQGMMGMGKNMMGSMDMKNCTCPMMRGQGPMAPVDTLTEDHVRTMLENDLSWQGNTRLKVGAVKTGEDGNIVGDIVTQDGALVDRWSVDPKTGAMQRMQ
jgi:hypothetical protein